MLAQDFSVPYEDKTPTGRSLPRLKAPLETPEQQFKRMERHCFRVMSDYYHLLRRWERDYAPQSPEEAWNPLFTEALQNKAKIEYLLDVLLSPCLEERAFLVMEYGKEVRSIERRMAEFAARDTAGAKEPCRQRRAAPER